MYLRQFLKHTLKLILPSFILKVRSRRLIAKIHQQYGALPAADVFINIYRKGAWGTVEDEPFCSGSGSAEKFAVAYAQWVNKFTAEKDVRSILDLGCGDFRVGRLLDVRRGMQYTGVDIVPDLIRHCQQRFQRPGIEFRCENIIDDNLPAAELCLIRQVLQHLSNQQIMKILKKCQKYVYLVITEEVYVGKDARPNLDKPHGPDIRTFDKSGVYVNKSPYSIPGRVVLEVPTSESTVIRTMFIEQ